MDSPEWYLESSVKWQKKGADFEEQNDLKKAEESYATAAEYLLLAARLSDENLKEKRLENAKALIAHVDFLREKISAEQYKTPKQERAPAHSQRGNENETSDEFLARIGVDKIDIPNVSFDDVAGLDRLKEDIRSNIILPFTNQEAARIARELDHRPGGGKLLYGPPGTGKTFICKAIAHEAKAFFIHINPPDLLSQWFGEFEINIKKLFAAAREHTPCVLFFDEIDALAPKRTLTNSSVMKRAVPSLLTELDGIKDQSNNGLLVIGATNEPWMIDDALLRHGRLGEKIYVPPPDLEARKKIFEINLKNAKTDAIDYEELARKTDGYSGADIKYICDKAKDNVYKEVVGIDKNYSNNQVLAPNTNVRAIQNSDLLKVIEITHPTISQESIKRYEQFGKLHDM